MNKNHWCSLLVILVVSACSPQATHELTGLPAERAHNTASPISPDEPTGHTNPAVQWEHIDPSGQTVVFWHSYTGRREETLQEIVESFNASNEWDITVNTAYQGYYGEIFDKMLPVLDTPAAPNLVVAYQDQAAIYYQMGPGLIDMTSLVESNKWGLSEADRKDFFPGVWTQDVFPAFGNARLGLPLTCSMEVMYYNADWLAELGYAGPPATPDEFKEIACKAVEQPFSKATVEGNIGYELIIDASHFTSWTFAFGGDVFDYNHSLYTYDSKAAQQAMSFLQDLFDSGCVSLVADSRSDDVDFGAGKLLFKIGSTSSIPAIKKGVEEGVKFLWNVDVIPHTTIVPVQNIYGASISITRTTPEGELAAWLFLKYFISPQVQIQWTRDSAYFPVRASVAEGLSDLFTEDIQHKTMLYMLKFSTHAPPLPGYDLVREKMSEALAAITSGTDVYETLETLNQEANTILSEQTGLIEFRP